MRDDADEASVVVDDREMVDVVFPHYLNRVFERLVGVDGDERRRHDGRRGKVRRVPPSGDRAACDVAVGNDPDDFIAADDGNSGAVVIEHQHGYETERRRRIARGRIGSHGIADFHHGKKMRRRTLEHRGMEHMWR